MKNFFLIFLFIFSDLVSEKSLVGKDNSNESCLLIQNFQLTKPPPPQQYNYIKFDILIADCCKDVKEFIVVDVLLDVNDPNNKTENHTISHEQDEFNYSMISHKKLSIIEYSRVENRIGILLNKVPPGDHCLRFLFLDGCKNVSVEDFNFTLP
jgi:hypothetical protein